QCLLRGVEARAHACARGAEPMQHKECEPMNAGQFCPGRSMLRRRMILALPVCLLLLLLQIFPARAASPRQAAQAEKSAVESAVETTNGFREIIKRAKDKVFPAVVFIRCMSENMEEGKKTTQSSSGSGV